MRAGVVWVAFGLVHLLLAFLGVVVVPAEAFHDLELYRWWMYEGLEQGTWRVLDAPWVYPAGALVPMLLPALVTTWSTSGYALLWCLLVTVLDAVAVHRLLRGGPRGATAALWWVGFVALHGPVAMGRLDGVVAPLVVLALVEAARRPRLATVLLTVGAWVKVAPGALLLPLVAASRRPLRAVVLPAAAVSLVVVAVVVALGGGRYVASFLEAQGERGLQTESVAATGWVLASLVDEDVAIRLNVPLVTWEVYGPGIEVATGALDLLLPLAVAAVGTAALLARQRRRAGAALVPGALTLVVVLVVVNKVGSPQFLAWIGAGVAALVATSDALPRAAVRTTRAVAVVGLAAAGLTQLVFPWGYQALLTGDVAVTAVLVLRNVLLVVLLVLAARVLVLTVRGERPPEPPGPGGRGRAGRAPAGTAAALPPR